MLLKSKKDDPTDQIFVFFPEGEKVGVKEIRKYVTLNCFPFLSGNNFYRYCIRMKDEGVQRALIIIKTNLTAIAKQVLLLTTTTLFNQPITEVMSHHAKHYPTIH